MSLKVTDNVITYDILLTLYMNHVSFILCLRCMQILVENCKFSYRTYTWRCLWDTPVGIPSICLACPIAGWSRAAR